MENYLKQIEKLKKEIPILQGENFKAASSGTRFKVFLSDKYVIRFRNDNSKLLKREANFLKQLNHPLVPKVLWEGEVDGSAAMVENRLPGETIDKLWKTFPEFIKINIIKQVVQFLHYLRIQNKDYIYSVNTGKKYITFLDCLIDTASQKIVRIKKVKQADELLASLVSIINNFQNKELFINAEQKSLVHGDLIIHNLLTDGKNLTGVLDWEFAFYSDPDYDLSRLFYYQECAKAYKEQGIDETFEAEYMDKLIAEISNSNLIKDIVLFQKKYRLIRAVFYLNALDWAVNSNSPEKNIRELINQWNKKTGLSR